MSARYHYDPDLDRWVTESGACVEWHRFSTAYLVSFDIRPKHAVFIWVRDGQSRHEVARGLVELDGCAAPRLVFNDIPCAVPNPTAYELYNFTIDRFARMQAKLCR